MADAVVSAPAGDAGAGAVASSDTITNGAPKTPPAAEPKKEAAPAAQPGKMDDAAKARIEAAKEKRKYKLKVDGAEQDLELDDTELTTRLQKGLAAEKRMAEAANLRKKVLDIAEAVKKDPFAALKDPLFGELDLEKIAEQRLAAKYKQLLDEQNLTEEQKALKAVEAERDQLKKQHEELLAEQERRANQEYEAKIWQETEADFTAALELADLPKNFETLYEMARVARLNLKYGVKLTKEQLAAEVRNSVEQSRGKLENSVRAGLEGDKLLAHLGDETVKRVVKAVMAKYGKKAPPAFIEKPVEEPVPEDVDKQPRKQLSHNDFRKWKLGLD